MQEIRPLTSLRGFAALAVVMQHFSATAQAHTRVTIPSLVPHGYMAVDFFFVLSGFIMCLIYLNDFQVRGLQAFPSFLMKRVARIAPLNVAVLLALMIAGVVSRAVLKSNIFFDDSTIAFDLPANLLMLQGLGIGKNLNGPSWSISTEFAAYFLFPAFVALMFHSRAVIWRGMLLVALGGLCALAMNAPRLDLATDTIATSVARCFAEFVLGMAAFRGYAYLSRNGRRAGDLTTGLLYAACLAGLVVRIDLLVALLCPFVVVATAMNRGYFARALSGGVPYSLGLISFSLYLVHSPLRPLASKLLWTVHPGPVGPLAALSFALIGSLAVIPLAWVCYRAVERPGRTVVRRWATGWEWRPAS